MKLSFMQTNRVEFAFKKHFLTFAFNFEETKQMTDIRRHLICFLFEK